MGTRGVLVRHAREHGGVIAVVIVTVLGVLVAGTFADASESDVDVAPSVSVEVTVPADLGGAALGATPSTEAASGGFLSPTAPLVPIGDAVAPSNDHVAPSKEATDEPSENPIGQLPPLGDLSSVDAGIRSLCSAVLTPFGLYATVFGLVGGAIPFTLPELPFYILVGPISDLCLQLEGLTP